MSSATDGDYDDDLGHGYIRRPISVAQLLEREGYRPAVRSRATRRALTGVAAGAVLALGAVVGSLLLNHAGDNAAGNTLASGSTGADIVLSNHQPAPSQTSAAQTSAATQNGTAAISNTTQPQVVQNGGHGVTSHPKTVQRPGSAGGVTVASPSTPATPGTSAAPATSTTPAAPVAGTTTPDTSTSAGGNTPPAASSSPSTPTSSGSSGGLLGNVTGTLTGTLSSVTQPVFSWFGS